MWTAAETSTLFAPVSARGPTPGLTSRCLELKPRWSVLPTSSIWLRTALVEIPCKERLSKTYLIGVKTIWTSAPRLVIEVIRQSRRAGGRRGNSAAALQLAASPVGRIVLHAACALRDHRFRWHWAGVARELASLELSH